MAEPNVPSRTFLQYLRSAMENIGARGGRGLARGAENLEDFMSPRRISAAGAYGGQAGAMMGGLYGGANAHFQEDDLGEAGAGALGGGLAGALGGVGAGMATRGGARALRLALQRALEQSRHPTPMAMGATEGPMALRQQLEELQRLFEELDDSDPRKMLVAMRIEQLMSGGMGGPL